MAETKLTIRLDDAELETIKERAAEDGVSVQKWALATLLRADFVKKFKASVAEGQDRYGDVLAEIDAELGDAPPTGGGAGRTAA
jgi:hypothetical protein